MQGPDGHLSKNGFGRQMLGIEVCEEIRRWVEDDLELNVSDARNMTKVATLSEPELVPPLAISWMWGYKEGIYGR